MLRSRGHMDAHEKLQTRILLVLDRAGAYVVVSLASGLLGPTRSPDTSVVVGAG